MLGLLFPPTPPHMYPIYSSLRFSGVSKYRPSHQPGPICRAVAWLVFISLFLSVSASPSGEAGPRWDRTREKRNASVPGSAADPVPSSHPTPMSHDESWVSEAVSDEFAGQVESSLGDVPRVTDVSWHCSKVLEVRMGPG